MKKMFLLGGIMIVLLAGAGCKPESPTLFTSPASLYFGAPNVFSLNYTSGTQFSFATYPHRTVDTFLVQITLSGTPSPKDRSFSVVPLDTTAANAVEGTDYLLQPSYTLPANAASVNIPVILYRTPILDSVATNFYLKVVPNKDFSASTNAQSVYNIQVTYLQKPSTWDLMPSGVTGWAGVKTNFGTWTKTKYLLILNALYNPVTDSSVANFPYYSAAGQYPPVFTQYLQLVKNYLNLNYPGNYGGVGPTLRDPDAPNDTTIKVGPADY
jgi:hypothetical protein